MTQPVIRVDVSTPIEAVGRVLEARCVRRVLVHDALLHSDVNRLAGFVGVVSDHDLFRSMGTPTMSPGEAGLATRRNKGGGG